MRTQSWKQSMCPRKSVKGFSKGMETELWFTAQVKDFDSQVTEEGSKKERRRWAERGSQKGQRQGESLTLTEGPGRSLLAK